MRTSPKPRERPRIRVGPNRDVRTLGEAARLCVDGMSIEVDAGDYVGDTAVWLRDDLSLRAIGGRVRLIAAERSAEGKGIWVVRAARFSVEGFDFQGATVPDRNGAGIRLDRGSLRARNCTFRDNENGILVGNDRQSVLEVAGCEFGHNGSGDGYSHNLYAGTIARLSVRESYFHHARVGHLLKTRAEVNDIINNRLDDGPHGRASYELEFPDGGRNTVSGNLIVQSALTQNSVMFSMGAEARAGTPSSLVLEGNTFVNEAGPDGRFIRVWTDRLPSDLSVRIASNVFAGPGRLDLPESWDGGGNRWVRLDEVGRLRAG